MSLVNKRTKPAKPRPDTTPGRTKDAMKRRLFATPKPPPTLDDLKLPAIEEPTPHSTVDKKFNQDLTNMGPKTLARQHQYAVGMYSYVIACLAQVETQHAALRNARSRLAAELRVIFHSGQQKWLLDDKILRDEDIVKLDRESEVTEAKRTLLKAQVDIYSSRVNLLSRELTRRKVEMEQRV